MTAEQACRNVALYRRYLTFNEPLLWGPILITCLIHLGHMELADIYLMEAVVVLGFVFLEVPSGALADLIGRKKTVVLGSVLHLVSMIWFALIQSPFDVWGANIVWMIGASLCSGADSAILYDSLKELGREGEYKQIEGAAVGNRLLIVAFCSLATGLIAETHLRVPLLLSIPGVIFSTVSTFFLTEPRAIRTYAAREHFNMMKMSVLFVANHRAVKWIIGFSMLITVSSKVWFFTYNPYFELVKLPIAHYGIMFFLLNVVAWFFSRYAYSLERRLSEQKVIVLMILMMGFPIIFMGSVVAVFSVGVILLQNAVRGFERPFLGAFFNNHLDSENRATVISIRSAVSGLAQFLGLGIFGIMLNNWSLPFCLQLLGIAVLLLGVLSLRKYRQVFS
ncbi:MAG: hypothetical protein RLY47_300 [Candidatus Parcubacteria bacterium]|jgi:MFS family permease